VIVNNSTNLIKIMTNHLSS